MFDVAASAPEERPVASVKAELATVCADEIQDGAEGLVLRAPQSSAQLLKKQGGTLGRAQHQHGVHSGHVDTLVEEVH
jgi:hypothetical protein